MLSAKFATAQSVSMISIFSIEVRQRRREWREDLLQKPFFLKQQKFKQKDIR